MKSSAVCRPTQKWTGMAGVSLLGCVVVPRLPNSVKFTGNGESQPNVPAFPRRFQRLCHYAVAYFATATTLMVSGGKEKDEETWVSGKRWVFPSRDTKTEAWVLAMARLIARIRPADIRMTAPPGV